MTRARMEAIPAATEALRDLRFWPSADFDDVTIKELENAGRWLRAAAYSANEGARKIAGIIAQRKEQPCTSDPNATGPNGITDDSPPAT